MQSTYAGFVDCGLSKFQNQKTRPKQAAKQRLADSYRRSRCVDRGFVSRLSLRCSVKFCISCREKIHALTRYITVAFTLLSLWWSMSTARFADRSTSPRYTVRRPRTGRLNANRHPRWPQNTACRFNDILIEKTSAHCPLYLFIRLCEQHKSIKYMPTYALTAH